MGNAFSRQRQIEFSRAQEREREILLGRDVERAQTGLPRRFLQGALNVVTRGAFPLAPTFTEPLEQVSRRAPGTNPFRRDDDTFLGFTLPGGKGSEVHPLTGEGQQEGLAALTPFTRGLLESGQPEANLGITATELDARFPSPTLRAGLRGGVSSIDPVTQEVTPVIDPELTPLERTAEFRAGPQPAEDGLSKAILAAKEDLKPQHAEVRGQLEDLGAERALDLQDPTRPGVAEREQAARAIGKTNIDALKRPHIVARYDDILSRTENERRALLKEMMNDRQLNQAESDHVKQLFSHQLIVDAGATPSLLISGAQELRRLAEGVTAPDAKQTILEHAAAMETAVDFKRRKVLSDEAASGIISGADIAEDEDAVFALQKQLSEGLQTFDRALAARATLAGTPAQAVGGTGAALRATANFFRVIEDVGGIDLGVDQLQEGFQGLSGPDLAEAGLTRSMLGLAAREMLIGDTAANMAVAESARIDRMIGDKGIASPEDISRTMKMIAELTLLGVVRPILLRDQPSPFPATTEEDVDITVERLMDRGMTEEDALDLTSKIASAERNAIIVREAIAGLKVRQQRRSPPRQRR